MIVLSFFFVMVSSDGLLWNVVYLGTCILRIVTVVNDL